MRNEIVRRCTIITGIALIAFFLVSILITSYINKKSLEVQLINVANMVAEEMQDTTTEAELNNLVDRYTKNQKWLSIVVATDLGFIIKDSNDDSLNEQGRNKRLEAFEISKKNVVNNLDRVYVLEGQLCYIFLLKEDTLVRTSIIYDTNEEYIYSGLFAMILVMIVTLLICVITTRRIGKSIMETFDNITSHLKTINEGEYKQIALGHKYEEVESVLEEVNEINNNIYTSIRKIKQEHDKVNFIINNLQQGLMIVDEHYKILLINSYFAKLLSKEDINVEGEDFNDVLSNDFFKKQIKLALDKKDDYYFDLEDELRERIYAVTINYLKKRWDDINNKVGLIIIGVTDVTEERTNDKLKAEFISNASHELKTPITSIRGFSELLLSNEENYDKSTLKKLNVIYQEALRMKNTIDELLYLSNLEYNKDSVDNLEVIDLNYLVQLVTSKLNDLATKTNVQIKTSIDDVKMNGEPSMFEHLLTNLVENAIRYNKPNGYVNIKITNEKYKIILSVEDSGIGIDEKYIPRLYDRFFRIDSSRNRNTGGTGLGLNIVKQICAKMNAKIEVNSKIDVGTTFKVIFNKEG